MFREQAEPIITSPGFLQCSAAEREREEREREREREERGERRGERERRERGERERESVQPGRNPSVNHRLRPSGMIVASKGPSSQRS